MKHKKIVTFTVVIFVLMLVFATGCSKQEKVVEDPYLKYTLTTYSGGNVVDTIEIYSDMGWRFHKNFIAVWNNSNEDILLFYSTLDYTINIK